MHDDLTELRVLDTVCAMLRILLRLAKAISIGTSAAENGDAHRNLSFVTGWKGGPLVIEPAR